MKPAYVARLGQRIATLAEQRRRWGILRVLYMHLMQRLGGVLNLSFALVRPLGGVPVVHERAGCSIRLATLDELLAAAEDPDMYLDKADVRAALGRGELCIGGFDGDRLVSYTWRAFKAAPLSDDLCVRFDPPCRYGYKALTHPAYRGRHIHDAMAPYADQACIEQGFTLGVSYIETHNYASLRSARRIGTRIVGLIGYVRLGGRVLPFRTRGAARYGFEFCRLPSRPDAG